VREHGHKLKQEYTFSGDESGKSQQPTVDRKQLCHHWTSAVQRTVSEYCTLAANTFPIATAEAEHMFSKVEHTLTGIRSAMHESCLEALLLQQHRTLTPSVAAVVDQFALTSISPPT